MKEEEEQCKLIPSHTPSSSSSSSSSSKITNNELTSFKHNYTTSSVNYQSTLEGNSPAVDIINANQQEEEEEPLLQQPTPGKSSPLDVLFNISNSTVGAGVLAIPFAFHQSGILLGCFILIFVCVISTFTSQFLLRACEISKQPSYKEVGMKAFRGNKIAGFCIDILMIVFCFGVMVGYTSIIGDYSSSLFKAIYSDYIWQGEDVNYDNILFSKNFNSFLLMITVMLPLSCLRRIGFLFFTSYFTIACVIYTLFVILYGFFSKVSTLDKRIDHSITLFQSWDNFSQVFVAFPVLFFAFGNTVTLIPIYYELKNKNQKTMTHVINGAGLLCLLIYLITGIFGYVQFGDNGIKENILNSFRQHNVMVIFAKVAMIIVSVISYPLVHFPARQNVEQLLFPNRPFSYIRWIIEAIVFSTLTLLILLIPFDLVTIFGITGASVGMIIMFIFPCVFYAILETNKIKRGFAILLAFICLILGVISSASVIADFIQKVSQ